MTTHTVFVYGTLLKGEINHSYYLCDSTCKGNAAASGYIMYNIGAFPGIVPGEGTVPGELYEVDDETMDNLDYLEGEGSLYIREKTAVTMPTGEETMAWIYVYNGSVDGLERIPVWRRGEYVWYVSYGSNMFYDRFIHYIIGGAYEGGGACHPACDDLRPPVAVRCCDIPYDMYYAEASSVWGGGGVSFLDLSRPGRAKGVAYLITEEQFAHVAREENGGIEPGDGIGWYGEIVELGELDGFRAVTFTSRRVREYNAPSSDYLRTLRLGMREHYPEMGEEEIEEWLRMGVR